MAVFQTILEQYRILNTTLYGMPYGKYKEIPIKRWKSNRPPDMSRVNEIHNSMKESGKMDGVINLACIGEDGLVCIEGNHRRMALKDLDTDFVVFVDILWDATDEIAISEFNRLNKAISVPDLYIEETDAVTKANVQTAVSDIIKRFPKHQSTSRRPNSPNYNRDNLTDQIFNLQKDLKISITDIMTRVYALNDKLALADKSKLSEPTKKKCSETGLWLFAWSRTINLN